MEAGTSRLLEEHRERLLRQAVAMPAAPDLSRYCAVAREHARLQWLNRVAQEHHSVVDFADLLALLADIDAPYAALCALERILADELRHVAYFREVVAWFGGSDDLVLDLTRFRRPPSSSPTADPLQVAIERVTVEIYVAESSSLPIQRAALEWVSEPALRQVLTMHMEEEGLHTALGKAIQRALIEAAPACDRDRLADRVRELESSWRERMWQIHQAAARQDAVGRELGAGITRDDVDRARSWARP